MPTSRLLESPSGNGHLERKGTAERIGVSYRLNVTQEMIPTGLGSDIPGLTNITGLIEAPSDPHLIMRLWASGPREQFTLYLNDNRKLDISFSNSNGSIEASGGFY